MCPCANPIVMWKEDWEMLEIKVRSMNHLCLLDLVLLNVSRDEITNKSWEKLGNLSQSKSLVNKLFFFERNCFMLGWKKVT